LVEAVGDDFVEFSLQLFVVLDALFALASDLLADGFRGPLTIDPSGPTVVGPV